MASPGSIQSPGAATPEEAALWGFPPDAEAFVDGVSYVQEGVAVVAVSFTHTRSTYQRRVHRHGDNDWRPESLPWEPFVVPDPERDLAEQLLGKRFDNSIVVTAATGSRGPVQMATTYTLQLKLTYRLVPEADFPLRHRALTNFVKWYMRSSGVKVLMRTQGSRD